MYFFTAVLCFFTTLNLHFPSTHATITLKSLRSLPGFPHIISSFPLPLDTEQPQSTLCGPSSHIHSTLISWLCPFLCAWVDITHVPTDQAASMRDGFVLTRLLAIMLRLTLQPFPLCRALI